VGTLPAQIRHAYGVDQLSYTGAGTTIAIVDAYDDPKVLSDLQAFDARFGLPNPKFTKLNQNGATSPLPAVNNAWAPEIALDVEWAHAIAPGADILLVEANAATVTAMFTAVRTAASRPGVVAVSMSFGTPEFLNEASYDPTFRTPSGHTPVTFLAASGDEGAPPVYPSTSPNVISVGGTTTAMTTSGNITSETGWSGSGGGLSAVEPQPSYQLGVVTQSTSFRTSPDVAYDASPNTGFAVYLTQGNSTSSPWVELGGTSAAAPQWAALIALADQGRAANGVGALDGRSQVLPMLYSMPQSNFRDITAGGSTGLHPLSCGPGYDLVTGRGTPHANLIVPALISVTSTTLANSVNLSIFRRLVTFTATVTPTFYAATPTGTVSVLDGKVSLGNSPLSSGSSMLTASALFIDNHVGARMNTVDPLASSSVDQLFSMFGDRIVL
jgi:subtilase family serine protease